MCTLSVWLCIPVSRHRRIPGVIIFCLVSWGRISHWTWRSLFIQLGWWTVSPSDQSSFVPVPSIGVTGIHGHTDLSSDCCGSKIVSPCLLNKSILTEPPPQTYDLKFVVGRPVPSSHSSFTWLRREAIPTRYLLTSMCTLWNVHARILRALLHVIKKK